MPFSYMGSLVTSDGKSDRDIKQRIGKAKTVFGNTKNVLINPKISLMISLTRLRVLYCYVFCCTDVKLGNFKNDEEQVDGS